MRNRQRLEVQLHREVRPGHDPHKTGLHEVGDLVLVVVSAAVVIEQDQASADQLLEKQPLPQIRPLITDHRRNRQVQLRLLRDQRAKAFWYFH
jgi:hypothetical protein